MRRSTIVPAIALSLMSFGVIAQVTPASAHPVVHTGEDGDDSTTITNPSVGEGSSSGAGGASSTPAGGVSTGAGGTAPSDAHDLAPWLVTGAAGIAFVGASAAALRRGAASI